MIKRLRQSEAIFALDQRAGGRSTSLEKQEQTAAKRALKREEAPNHYQLEFRQAHVERLDSGSCRRVSKLLFLDTVDYFEKIGDHLTNIAQAVAGGLRGNHRT